MKIISIRAAEPADLSAIEAIENRCFRGSRRASRRSLAHSLQSPSQSVWLAEVDGGVAGAMTLHHRSHSIRIYSLGVLPPFRGSGAGRRLVKMAVALARTLGFPAVTLEADRRNRVLVRWYERFGFEVSEVMKDYYSPGRHAVRMRLALKPVLKGGLIRGGS
jgi:ribosomal-protein-alanine N-acetyltransferase